MPRCARMEALYFFDCLRVRVPLEYMDRWPPPSWLWRWSSSKALRILMKVPVSRSLANFSFVVMRLPPLHFGAGRQSVSVERRFCVSGGGWRLVSVGIWNPPTAAVLTTA